MLSSCVWTVSASLGVASERRSSAATWRTIDLYVYHCQPCNVCSRVVGHPLLIDFFLGERSPNSAPDKNNDEMEILYPANDLLKEK